MSFMLYSCYLRNGIVYVPTIARVEAGGHMDIEPVAVVPVARADELRRAFLETIGRGNPVVPTPTRANHPKPVVPKYAGVRSNVTFVRSTSTWSLMEAGSLWRIIGYRRQPDNRSWEKDSDQIVALPAGSSVGEVCERMMAILQEAARQ